MRYNCHRTGHNRCSGLCVLAGDQTRYQGTAPSSSKLAPNHSRNITPCPEPWWQPGGDDPVGFLGGVQVGFPNGSATPDTVKANPSRSNSPNQICARCAGAPTSSNLAASGDMSDSVSLTSKTSSAGSRGPSELIGWSFPSFSSSAVGRGSRAVARWRGRILDLASGSTGPGRRSRPGSSGEEVHRGERQHDLVVLVEGLDGGAHKSPVRFGARGTRLGDRDADAQLVAGSHGSRPAELVEAGRGQAGYPGDVVVDVEPHARGDRVDTARDQPVERTRRRPSRVGVDGLRVVVPGEGDDLRLAQARVTELVNRPRHVSSNHRSLTGAGRSTSP